MSDIAREPRAAKITLRNAEGDRARFCNAVADAIDDLSDGYVPFSSRQGVAEWLHNELREASKS